MACSRTRGHATRMEDVTETAPLIAVTTVIIAALPTSGWMPCIESEQPPIKPPLSS